MALLGDDQLRLVMRHFHILLPFIHSTLEFLGIVEGKLLRRSLHQVVFIAIDEHDHIGILLDRTRLTQIRKLRALVFAAFHGARQLRQRNHRHRQFLGQSLQPLGDHADFKHAAFRPRPRRRAHQLQIVNNDQIKPLGALQAPAACAERGNADRRRVINIQRQGCQFAAHFQKTVKIALADLAPPDAVTRNARFFGQQTCRQLIRAHFQGE